MHNLSRKGYRYYRKHHTINVPTWNRIQTGLQQASHKLSRPRPLPACSKPGACSKESVAEKFCVCRCQILNDDSFEVIIRLGLGNERYSETFHTSRRMRSRSVLEPWKQTTYERVHIDVRLQAPVSRTNPSSIAICIRLIAMRKGYHLGTEELPP
jgi:hypothetical protein